MEVKLGTSVVVTLTDGTAEIFGAELPKGTPVDLPGGKHAIFSWHGATIEMLGEPEHCYVAGETPMVEYANVEGVMEARRRGCRLRRRGPQRRRGPPRRARRPPPAPADPPSRRSSATTPSERVGTRSSSTSTSAKAASRAPPPSAPFPSTDPSTSPTDCPSRCLSCTSTATSAPETTRTCTSTCRAQRRRNARRSARLQPRRARLRRGGQHHGMGGRRWIQTAAARAGRAEDHGRARRAGAPARGASERRPG